MADYPFDSAKVKTGVPGLNDLIEGGFERGAVVLVAGDAGCGKSTFANQYLFFGATMYDEPGVLITFEEKKIDVYRHMARYGWDLEQLEREKKLLVFEYPPHEIERFISEGEIIEDAIKSIGAKRLVIDSVTSFALVFDSGYKRRQGLLKLLDSVKKWGCTTIMTAEASVDSRGDFSVKFGMGYLTDGLIYLYNIRTKEQKEQRQKAMEIIKMRGIKHYTNIVPMTFSEHGIKVYAEPIFEKFVEGK